MMMPARIVRIPAISTKTCQTHSDSHLGRTTRDGFEGAGAGGAGESI